MRQAPRLASTGYKSCVVPLKVLFGIKLLSEFHSSLVKYWHFGIKQEEN